ncbi:MAG: hypothetical protein ACYSWU_12615 [Planctomycetota bacterium]|jgi:hypothetical protein
MRQINATTYAHDLQADDGQWEAVEVGDSEQSLFLPKARLGRWGKECGIDVGIAVAGNTELRVLEAENRLEYEGRNLMARFYPQGHSYEFDAVLLRKPTSNVLRWPILPWGLEFHYQPALTQQEIEEEKAHRPDNVVGSYAVYHSVRRSIHAGSDAFKFKAGKAYSIPCPYAIDSRGDSAKCVLNIDLANNVLEVWVPQWFLDSATYPVVIDPEFGYHTIGGSSGARSSSSVSASALSAPASSGVTDYFYAYSAEDSELTDMWVGLYTDSSGPDALVSGSPVANMDFASWTAEWHQLVMGSISVTGSTNYWLALNSSSSYTLHYDTPGGTNRYWDNSVTGGTWNATFEQDASSAAKYSFYVEYTASGGASVVPLRRRIEGY